MIAEIFPVIKKERPKRAPSNVARTVQMNSESNFSIDLSFQSYMFSLYTNPIQKQLQTYAVSNQ
jgi:hypothetical protein